LSQFETSLDNNISNNNMTIARPLSQPLVQQLADCQDLRNIGSTHSQQDARKTVRKSPNDHQENKSVWFPPEDRISSTILIESSNELQLDMKNELWWTSDELKESSGERKNLIKQFVQEKLEPHQNQENQEQKNETVNKKLSALYKDCSCMNVVQVLRSKSNKQLLIEIAEMRGLEAKFCRSISENRRRHALTILSVAGALEITEDSLSRRSAQSSRPSQILARVLAQVDANECKQ
jgi:hypothetical protein